MATFDVRFLGCKVSHLDAQDVRARLLADGHTERADGDVAVVNTCCVTHEAVSKSRQAAARAARTHRRVYVTGCAANLGGGALDGLPDNVVVVEPAQRGHAGRGRRGRRRARLRQRDARLERVRAFVKIQDGCSFSCNFCVIPLVRGGTRSRTADAVLREIRRRVDQGHTEIVLTGINLGCFRDRDAGYTLARLVRAAGETPGLARLRLSSIEINHVDRELVAALRETPTVARHLHVPLQSGDDGVLRAMGRRYTRRDVPAPARRADRLQSHGRRHRRLPGRGRARVREHAARRPRGAPDEAARLSVLAAARHEDGRRGSGADAREARTERAPARAVTAACLEHWRSKLGRDDVVLVDRPGRGYGDDYSPWLVRGEVGQLVRARAAAVTDDGILAA